MYNYIIYSLSLWPFLPAGILLIPQIVYLLTKLTCSHTTVMCTVRKKRYECDINFKGCGYSHIT